MSTKMKRTVWITGTIIVLVAAYLVYAVILRPEPAAAFTPAITDAAGNEIPGSIAVIETVTLGGVEQTITIRGVDTNNPVLLLLHGGPGMPSSPWATWNGFHAELEEHFVLVHWDQRGAGKSFSKDLTPEEMHLENFVSDTLELTDILRQRFGQDKIFLWGHSWGSGLGFEVLQVNSEPYHVLFVTGVRPDWNTGIELAHEKVLEMARQANDAEAIETLDSIQPFDPANMEHLQVHFQILSKYRINDFHTEGLEEAWLDYVLSKNSPEYPPTYIKPTLAGMDFTRQTIYLEVIESGFDLAVDFPVSPIPVHFLHGRYDYACPGVLAEEYYNLLGAPDKSFTWFENSAHDVYYDEPDKFNKEIIRIAQEVMGTAPGLALDCTLEMDMDATYRVGEFVPLRFELHNRTNRPLYTLIWYTPMEGVVGEIFQITRDGEELPYRGMLAKRGDPMRREYVAIQPGGTVSTGVDLRTVYDLSVAGSYQVQFTAELQDVTDDESLLPRKRDDHQPQPLTCNPVSFIIRE